MKTSAALPGKGGSMTMNWSQPMPVRRSAIAAARAAVSPSGAARSSSTTKSLPQPCILMKGVGMAPPLYGGGCGGASGGGLPYCHSVGPKQQLRRKSTPPLLLS